MGKRRRRRLRCGECRNPIMGGRHINRAGFVRCGDCIRRFAQERRTEAELDAEWRALVLVEP